MKKVFITNVLLCFSVVIAFFLFACSNQQNSKPDFATATITGTKPDTAVSGMARFTKDGNKVKMALQLTIPSKANESVAVHIHENGNCGDTGKAAGGHWNPTSARHGQWGSNDFHVGDIGNVNIDASGNGKLELESDLWSLGEEAGTNLFNKTIVVHTGVDDYSSQPGGNSGERIGCGIISKTDK